MLVIIILLAIIAMLLVGGAVQKGSQRLRSLAKGLLISHITIVLILAGGEAYLRFVFAESGNLVSLSSLNWLDRFWETNSFGYRDYEWNPEDLVGKTKIVVVGDSLAAGWGIENPADRFSDVLAAQLGDDFAVLNMGVYGTATPEQLNLLREAPIQPDVVVLQYFLNDINYAGLTLGLLPDPQPTPKLVRESHLASFIYWRYLRDRLSNARQAGYWQNWSFNAYDNAEIWELHRQELNDFIDYVESIDARLITVIFPNMLNPLRSVAYVDRVADVFETRGHHNVLKLFDDVAAWDVGDRVVSPRDAHPSVRFHQHVGERLYELFFTAEVAAE